MAIQYSGAHRFTASVTGATRGALAAAIKDEMVAAGWTLLRTPATDDYYLESGTAANGLKCRCRVWDPGSGNCPRVQCMNTAETVTLVSPVFLLPGITYIFSGNAYHCMMQEATWTSTGRKWGMWGVGYTESFASGLVSAVAFQAGNGNADNATANGASWASGQGNNYFGTLWNGSAPASVGNGVGMVTLLRWGGAASVATTWAVDAALHVYEPLVAWSTIGFSDATDARVRMQLYDALVMAGSWAAGTEITWDSKVWRAVTNLNTTEYMTLFVLKGNAP